MDINPDKQTVPEPQDWIFFYSTLFKMLGRDCIQCGIAKTILSFSKVQESDK